MRHALFVLLTLFSLQLFGHYQEGESSLEVSTESLQKANEQLDKELDQVRNKLEKELKKAYPELSELEIDSLLQQQYQGQKEALKEAAKDTVTNYLEQVKEDLLKELKETPENLPVGKELKESISKLEELKNLKLQINSEEGLSQLMDLKDIKHLRKELDKVKEQLANYKEEFKNWDKVLMQKLESLEAAELLKAEMDKMQNYTPLPEGYRQSMKSLQSNDFVREQLQQKADELKAQGMEALQEKFDVAAEKLSTAKKEFPSLESVQDAPKRFNPYKDLPLLERLKYGANLQFKRQEPMTLDYAANLAYPFNKRLRLGIEGAGRIFLEQPEIVQEKKDLFSLRSFLRYELFKGFFLQTNYEANRLATVPVNETSIVKNWHQTGLVGFGKQFKLSKKLKMNSTVFYDLFFNANTSPYAQPWVFRVGVEL